MRTPLAFATPAGARSHRFKRAQVNNRNLAAFERHFLAAFQPPDDTLIHKAVLRLIDYTGPYMDYGDKLTSRAYSVKEMTAPVAPPF